MALTTELIARKLKSAAELAADKPHGTRIKYSGGCRCPECRKANSTYENERQKARRRGETNKVIDATPAREHLRKLARAGVGRNMVADATDIPRSTIHMLRKGTKRRCREETVRKILRVSIDSRGDNALVSGASTWRLIEALLEEGFTKTRIAAELGYKTPALQIKKHRVTVRIRARVEALYERLTT